MANRIIFFFKKCCIVWLQDTSTEGTWMTKTRITTGWLPLKAGSLLCSVPGTRCSTARGWGTKVPLCYRRILTTVIAAMIVIIMKPKESVRTKDRIQGLKCCFSVPCIYLDLQSLYLKQITTEHRKQLVWVAQKHSEKQLHEGEEWKI